MAAPRFIAACGWGLPQTYYNDEWACGQSSSTGWTRTRHKEMDRKMVMNFAFGSDGDFIHVQPRRWTEDDWMTARESAYFNRTPTHPVLTVIPHPASIPLAQAPTPTPGA